jgi:hypothetical protein
MKTIVGAALLTLTSLAAAPAQGTEPTYTLTNLGAAPEAGAPLGGTLKMGINEHGDVAASRAASISSITNLFHSNALLDRQGHITWSTPC